MIEYFRLQLRRSHRRFTDFGFNALAGYVLIAAAFVFLSVSLFIKTEFAQYLYVLVALSLMGNLSEIKRIDFLKTTFKNADWRKIRIIENTLIVAPFVAFLLFQHLITSAVVLVLFAFLLSVNHFEIRSGRALPTPFSKKPFEFSVGFRKTILLLPVIYGVAVAAIFLNNFNLGVFALLAVYMVTMSYYSKPENEYYVWSHTLSAKRFLVQKIKTSLIHSTLLSLPVMAVLVIFFPDQIHYMMLALLAGLAFQACMVLIKYSAYPNEISVSQGVIVALCIYFPPLIAAAIPYFFYQAIQRLNAYLK
jgi:hypothetical protein